MTAAESCGVFFRQVYYTHDDDPVIAEVLSGDFDLIFFKHNILGNPFCRNLVLKHRDKVVSLFQDLTEYGVRCLDALRRMRRSGWWTISTGWGTGALRRSRWRGTPAPAAARSPPGNAA